jgi:hypothetical protein
MFFYCIKINVTIAIYLQLFFNFLLTKTTMKKLFLFTVLFSAIATSQAQYKKASFLKKKGRTYDLGLTSRVLGSGNSAALGFTFGYGKERSDKRLFHWWDLDYVLGNKYKYSTTTKVYTGSSFIETPIEVSGKTGSNLAWRYNLAYFILDNGNEDNKILPFVDLSVGLILSMQGRLDYTTSPIIGALPKKEVLPEVGGWTAGVGAGAIYRVNKGVGIKFTATYYGVLSTETKDGSNRDIFKTLPNHVGISVGAHWLLDRDND